MSRKNKNQESRLRKCQAENRLLRKKIKSLEDQLLTKPQPYPIRIKCDVCGLTGSCTEDELDKLICPKCKSHDFTRN